MQGPGHARLAGEAFYALQCVVRLRQPEKLRFSSITDIIFKFIKFYCITIWVMRARMTMQCVVTVVLGPASRVIVVRLRQPKSSSSYKFGSVQNGSGRKLVV